MLYAVLLLVVLGGAEVVIDPTTAGLGEVFDGIGGVSGGGGGSRLLLDYSEPQRGELLDLLFRPKYGASLHTLKVGIGCDGDTTQGAEPSHRHTADDTSPTAFDRGYETWLMAEAKQRNPAITLSGLLWGVPGWVADETGNVFTPRTADYLLSWIDGVKRAKGLHIDSVGVGYNERYYNTSWIKAIAPELRKRRVRTIAADKCCGKEWGIVEDMERDDALRDAIDIIGTHCPGPINGGQPPPAAARAMGKPLWDTEQHIGVPDPSSVPCWDWKAAQDLARVINQNYVTAGQTATMIWTPIYSWYSWLPYKGKGLLVANTPWSGAYAVSPTVWAVAHTTQFISPGWHFVPTASGLLRNGSYVTYSDGVGNVTVVIETMHSEGVEEVVLHGGPYHKWSTNESSHFVYSGLVQGGGRVAVPPNHIVTLTTTTGQRKADPTPPPARPFPFPYSTNFTDTPPDHPPRFFSDMHGAFSVEGGILRQHAVTLPVSTHGGTRDKFVSAIGDESWRCYTLSTRARVVSDPAGFVVLGGHVGGYADSSWFHGDHFVGVSAVVAVNGTWTLRNGNAVVANGEGGKWDVGDWLWLSLAMRCGDATRAVLTVNGELLAQVPLNLTNPFGPAYIGCGVHVAEFDDFTVV